MLSYERKKSTIGEGHPDSKFANELGLSYTNMKFNWGISSSDGIPYRLADFFFFFFHLRIIKIKLVINFF